MLVKGVKGGHLNKKMSPYEYRVPMLKIKQSCNNLIFNMGIPIPGKDDLYIETLESHHLWSHLSFLNSATNREFFKNTTRKYAIFIFRMPFCSATDP